MILALRGIQLLKIVGFEPIYSVHAEEAIEKIVAEVEIVSRSDKQNY